MNRMNNFIHINSIRKYAANFKFSIESGSKNYDIVIPAKTKPPRHSVTPLLTKEGKNTDVIFPLLSTMGKNTDVFFSLLSKDGYHGVTGWF